MKFDADCAREILLKIEEISDFKECKSECHDYAYKRISPKKLAEMFEDYEPREVMYNLLKLQEAGFLLSDFNKMRSIYPSGFKYDTLTIYDLTFEGAQYLETVRDPEIWKQIKNTLQDKAISLSFKAITAAFQYIINKRLS